MIGPSGWSDGGQARFEVTANHRGCEALKSRVVLGNLTVNLIKDRPKVLAAIIYLLSLHRSRSGLALAAWCLHLEKIC